MWPIAFHNWRRGTRDSACLSQGLGFADRFASSGTADSSVVACSGTPWLVTPQASPAPTQNSRGLDDDQAALPIRPPPRQEDPKQPLTRVETWTTRACSLQHRELMTQDNAFQQEVTATAKTRSHRRDPLGGPPAMNTRLPNNAPTTKFPGGSGFEKGQAIDAAVH
jgi:hypothetical protein